MEKIVNEVAKLVAIGWDEADAIRATANKYDVEDVELAMYFLDLFAKKLAATT